MLDRLFHRAAFWSALALFSVASAAASLGGDATGVLHSVRQLVPDASYLPQWAGLAGVGLAAPMLSLLAFVAALAGWRVVHRQAPPGDAASTRRAHADRLREAMQASADGVFMLRSVRNGDGLVVDFEVVDANPTGVRLLRAEASGVVGARLRGDAREWLDAEHFDAYVNAVESGTPWIAETRVNRRRFNAGWLLQQVVPIADGLAVTVRDITTSKRDERRWRRASVTDELTGLYNRRGFLSFAEQQMRVARRQDKHFALLYIDMDGFKQLNDVYGHGEGDRALAAVGRLLRRAVRDCDLVARMGGDEFTILALDADANTARLIQRRIEERVIALNAGGELAAPLALTIGHTRVRASDPAPLAELLARADALLLSRKRRRKVTAAAQQRANVNQRVPALRTVRPVTGGAHRRLPSSALEISVAEQAAAFA